MAAASTPTRVTFYRAMSGALGLSPATDAAVEVVGVGSVPAVFAVTDLAAASVSAAAAALAELVGVRRATPPPARVDRRLASMWFASSLRPRGWSLPAVWDIVAGDYQTSDGWIRLHTNAPHHRAVALKVLDVSADRTAVAKAVSRWSAAELENAIVDAGGCAATMHTLAEWSVHPQGRSVASEPLLHVVETDAGPPPVWPIPSERPLQGIRVLDLTRILAGPVATRFLAGFGADVLRIDPPVWDEPSVVPEVTLGKRCATLDLRDGNSGGTCRSDTPQPSPSAAARRDRGECCCSYRHPAGWAKRRHRQSQPGPSACWSWLVAAIPSGAQPGPPRVLVSFTGDGVAIRTAPLQQAAPPALGADKMFISTTHGAWVRMDDGGFGLTWVGFAFDDAGKFLATQRVRVAVQLDDALNGFTAPFKTDFIGADGQVVAATGGTVQGTRIQVEPPA